ncbi:molybdopterin-dependent oxidoreductase [Amycolatopsis sp. NPDC059021]|uniref:molybdopterin-dependent oxidoreductase n=1 Tax=Amycolatopsis sp. NPDC059021 TaxID=3346704 RepID=UPI003671FB10
MAVPDPLRYPMRRRPDGEFERVPWRVALADIGGRLRRLVRAHGGGAVGWYFGDPLAFSRTEPAEPLWQQDFLRALDTGHVYSAGAQDITNRFVASHLLYGPTHRVPVPDLARTDLVLALGAGPSDAPEAPRIRNQLRAVTGCGGRVVVLDPVRSETARAFEHVPLLPDGDPWLLLALLNVIFAEGREHVRTLQRTTGVETLRRIVAPHTPEATEWHTGVPADRVRGLAREIARAERAVVYGRAGTCAGPFGPLVAFLLDAVTIVTGHLDAEGGLVAGREAFPLETIAERAGLLGTPAGGTLGVLGTLPAAMLAVKSASPGPDRLRALFGSGGNPALAAPDAAETESAMKGLELFVSMGRYLDDTSRLAHYLLPTTPCPDADGEARTEQRIIEDLALRAGIVPMLPAVLHRIGRPLADFRRRRGTSVVTRAEPADGGYLFGDPPGPRIPVPARRVRLAPPAIVAEVTRLSERSDTVPAVPLKEIAVHAENAWLYDETLMRRARRLAPRAAST